MANSVRRIQIKIWPEITFIIPAIIPIDRLPSSKTNPIDLDFSNVYQVDSSGLAILLIAIIKFSKRIDKRSWDSRVAKDRQVDEVIRNLNFYRLLVKNIPNNNLFWQSEIENELRSDLMVHNHRSLQLTSMPIYELDFDNSPVKRDKVDEFKNYLIRTLYFLHSKHDFEVGILIQILIEMAKNSADHGEGNAYFGLDLYSYNSAYKLAFSFGDLGVGINQTVRQHLASSESSGRAGHLGLAETYQIALQVGATTKPNSGINMGIGMPTILELSKHINLKLSVFDAESRGLLSNIAVNSHAEIRKILYTIGFKVGFYYLGEVEIKAL